MLEKSTDLIQIIKAKNDYTMYSIVVPTFKRPETLKNTISSALSQDYKGVYSVVVVDNNPERDDETEQLMKSIADPRITYYKNSENVGMVNNWNQCIYVAESDWVIVVHDDDLLTEKCLTNIDEIISKKPDIEAVLPNFVQVNNPYYEEKNSVTFINLLGRFIRDIVPKSMPIEANLFCDNIYGPPTCGLALKRETVISFGGFSDRYIAADWDFMSRFSKIHKITKSKKQTGVYLWGVNASMKESTMEQIRLDRIIILKNIVEFSPVSSFFYKLLKTDFEKKFKSKTTDYVDYSLLYRIIRIFYAVRI